MGLLITKTNFPTRYVKGYLRLLPGNDQVSFGSQGWFWAPSGFSPLCQHQFGRPKSLSGRGQLHFQWFSDLHVRQGPQWMFSMQEAFVLLTALLLYLKQVHSQLGSGSDLDFLVLPHHGLSQGGNPAEGLVEARVAAEIVPFIVVSESSLPPQAYLYC